MLIQPLHKIQVLKSRKKHKPGSIGYVITQNQCLSYNAWETAVLFTQFGKKGKPRLEIVKVVSDIVDYDALTKAALDILDVVGKLEGITPSASPYVRRDWLGTDNRTKIEPIPMGHKNLLDIPKAEFIAYIIAHSILLYKLEGAKNVNSVVIGPLLTNRVIDVSVDDQPRGMLGYSILGGLVRDQINKTKDYQSALNAYFSDQDNQTRCIENLRRHLATLQGAYKHYMRDNILRAEGMDHRISKVISYYEYEKHAKELKDIKDNDTAKNPWLHDKKYLRIEDRGAAKRSKAPRLSAKVTTSYGTNI